MDNHSDDESVLPSDVHDASILKKVSEDSGEIQNGATVTVNNDISEMEDNGVTDSFEDKCSVQENKAETDSACNVILPKRNSISDETVTLFKTDDTIKSDIMIDNYEGKMKIESEIAPESVSSDFLALQSTTLCVGVNPAISSLSGEAAPVTNQKDAENWDTKSDFVSHEEKHCNFDTLEENTRPSKTTLIMLDDDEDEEERHERFLRIDTVEKPFGDGRNEAGEKMSALKRRMKKDDNEGSSSSSTTSSSVVLPKNARLVFRNLPMDYTTEQIKELLQEKLPPGVLLGEFPTVKEGRAVVEVTPSNTAEQAARLLHDIMIGDCKISVRKLITVDTADTVPPPASIPSITVTANIETVQATCDREGCASLVMQGDVHTQCCSHSICFAAGVFDPASCPHCLSVHARASAGELQARRLWRNRMQRMRKKRLQWVSEEVRLRFPHPDAPPRGNAVADASLTESTGLGLQASSSTTPIEGLAPNDSNPVVVEGSDDVGASLGRVRDRSAERNMRAAEIAELGSLVVSSKLEMQRRSKGKEYRVTINNIAYGFCLKEMLKMLQDVAGPVSFLNPRFGSLVVEFETAEAATTCHQRLDKTTFMTRKLSVTLHGEAKKVQQQQTVPSSPTAGDSSPNLKVRSAGEAVEPTVSADGGKLSAELQARLSTAAEQGVSTDNFVGPVAPISVKNRILMPGALTETFGFSPDVLESLNVTLPIVKELSVSNLNERATSADVRELFNVAGCVMGVQYDRARGTAVVEMRHPVEAVQAISLLHAQFYHNKPLTVRLHRANETLPQGGTTPPFPRGLQTIGKRLSIDKKVMAALQSGLTTPVQPTRQRQQKMTTVEKRQQNNVPLPAKRPQMGGSVTQRNMNGSTPADNCQNNSSMGQQRNNVVGQQQIISTTVLSSASRPGGPQGSAAGGGAPFTPLKQDHGRGAVGQNNGAGADWSAKNKRGARRLKRQAGSESDFGNPAKRKNPYWGNYRGPNATGNNAVNSVANDGNFQNSVPSSGPKFSSNYGQGNNSTNSNYGTLNRYTSSTSSSTHVGQQYSSSGTSNDWNSGNSSSWNDNYSNWNWQQPNTGDTAAYGGGGSSSSTATAGYGGTAPTGYTDNTSAGGYGAANASYATGAVRSYSNTTSNSNVATASYGSSSSSVAAAGYGGSAAPITASYSSSASTGYGVDGSSSSYSSAPPGGGGAYSGSSGAYSSGSGYYDSSGAPEAVGSAGAQSTAWAGQPMAKVPKYNSDGSFAGFS